MLNEQMACCWGAANEASSEGEPAVKISNTAKIESRLNGYNLSR